MKQTAVEWLYEKLEYANWMRNRDEISAGMADEWRKHYLDQAKAMEKEQIINAHTNGQAEYDTGAFRPNVIEYAEQYYNKEYGNET